MRLSDQVCTEGLANEKVVLEKMTRRVLMATIISTTMSISNVVIEVINIVTFP